MDEVPVALTLPGEVDETDAVLVPEAVPVPVTVDAVTEGLGTLLGTGRLMLWGCAWLTCCRLRWQCWQWLSQSLCRWQTQSLTGPGT